MLLVALFIDRALATFFGRLAPDFRSQLAAFRLRCQAQYPDAQSFAALTHEQQIAFLTQVERTPFFERVRLLTLLGMFALPKYGGNRDHVGWKLIGFQDQHIVLPPFGYYDRDYPNTSRASLGGMRYERGDSLAKTAKIAKVGDQNFRNVNF